MSDTKPELSVTEALAAADGPDLNLRPGSRMLSLADVEKLADDGDRAKLIAALGLVPVSTSLWPTKRASRIRPLRWVWTVTDHTSGEVLAQGHALFERWAWHRAGRGAARIYNKRVEAREAEAKRQMHPFFSRCEHGVQFLDECENCPNGCPVVPAHTEEAKP
jgi:hypothetical protein